MKIRFIGFKISVSGSPTLAQVLAEVATRDQDNMLDQHKIYLLNSDASADFHRGVVLTIKNQKNFLKLQQQQHTFRFKVETLDAASRLMDFNFFIVDKSSGYGVYLYYHHSHTINGFLDYLRLKRRECVQRQKEQSGKTPTGKMETAIICRGDSFEGLMRNYQRIKALDLQLLVPDVKGGLFQPLEPYLKKQNLRFLIDRKFSATDVAADIARCLGADIVKSGRVTAVDDEGGEHYLKLYNNPDYLDEVEFDTFTDKVAVTDLAAFYEASAYVDLEASYAKLKRIVA